MEAKIANNLIPVIPTHRPEFGHYLTVSVPNGWADVKKVCKKVLQFEGRNYSFTGWNSDRNDCYFRETLNVAKII
jgi:hypothetical protein